MKVGLGDSVSVEESEDYEDGTKPKKAKKKIAEDFMYKDTFDYRVGIDETLRPISDIQEIFNDMTAKALKLGFGRFLKHLNGRELRVATMCSGTESPLLALQLSSNGTSGILILLES
jgi:hypothetical protein